MLFACRLFAIVAAAVLYSTAQVFCAPLFGRLHQNNLPARTRDSQPAPNLIELDQLDPRNQAVHSSYSVVETAGGSGDDFGAPNRNRYTNGGGGGARNQAQYQPSFFVENPQDRFAGSGIAASASAAAATTAASVTGRTRNRTPERLRNASPERFSDDESSVEYTREALKPTAPSTATAAPERRKKIQQDESEETQVG